MIRFIKNILDIKNLLGMQRTIKPVPDPEYPANEIVIRNTAVTFYFMAYYTGDMTISYTDDNGNNIENNFPVVFSGTAQTISVMPNTDIVITGSITQFEILNNNSDFVALCNTATNLSISNGVKTLDLRNADSLFGIGFMPFGIETLYAKATTSSLQGVATSVINNSPTGGVLWIDPDDTYAASVIATAQAHGWTIYNL